MMAKPVAPTALTAQVISNALPYIRGFQGKTFVIRYGGSAMTEAALRAAFARDVAMLRLVGLNQIVVHGCGPRVDEMLAPQGAKPDYWHDLRVTDERTMRIVETVLSEINREIVGLINRHGARAVGLNGQDSQFLQARKLMPATSPRGPPPPDLGLLGEIERVDADLLNNLTQRAYVPVVMPIGVGAQGETYDLDPDLVAARLAETLRAEKLLVLTDAPGLLDRDGRLVNHVSAAEVKDLAGANAAYGGIAGTLDAALHALRHGVRSVHIVDGRVPNALLLEVLTSEGVGTTILADDAPQFLADTRRYLQNAS